MIRNKGIKMGTAHLKKYPKKLGILIPEDSEIDLTIKFGALPMYVFAPIKTAPAEMAKRVFARSPIKIKGSPPAVLKNTKRTGIIARIMLCT